MAVDVFVKKSEREDVVVSKSVPGTVLIAFKGRTRRFAVDYVVTDTDVADLPMSLDNLKAGGFIA